MIFRKKQRKPLLVAGVKISHGINHGVRIGVENSAINEVKPSIHFIRDGK